MPAQKPRKSAAPSRAPARTTQASAANRKGANRPSPKAGDLVEISEQAYELARLVEAQALDQDIAAILGRDHLPLMMQRVLLNSLSTGPAAAQATGLIMRLLKHPAASAADKQSADRGRPAALRSALVGRLTGGSGRAPVTVTVDPDAKALPF